MTIRKKSVMDEAGVTLGAAAGSRSTLLEVDELDVEDQCGVARDVGRGTASAVGQVGRAGQPPLLSDLHAYNSLVPSLDHLALSELEGEWLALCVRVEDFAVGQLADVAHAGLLPLLGYRAVSLLLDFDEET